MPPAVSAINLPSDNFLFSLNSLQRNFCSVDCILLLYQQKKDQYNNIFNYAYGLICVSQLSNNNNNSKRAGCQLR